MLQIEHLLDRRPDQLSGGQRQRVAIGRALVRDAAVFLFDEPLSNLDAQLRNELRVEIKRLHQRLGSTTMIYVTHDQIEALTLADRIAVMKDQQIQQLGTPGRDLPSPGQPVRRRLRRPPADELHRRQLIERDGPAFVCRRAPAAAGRLRASPTRPEPGQPVTLGVRPEHLAHRRRGWDGFTVDLVEPMGADNLVWCRDGELTLELRLPGDALAPGAPVPLAIDPTRISLFAAEGGQRL